MNLTAQDAQVERDAIEYARAHKKTIAKRLTDTTVFLSEKHPVSVFMAGVDLLLKNNDNSRRLYQAGIDQIDHHIPEKYSCSDVEQMIKTG